MTFKDFFTERAYHGTPFKITRKFDLNKIGSGEGNQVYGWGLYFAEEKIVAKSYTKIEPSIHIPQVFIFLGKELEIGSPENHVANLIQGKTINYVRNEIKRWIKEVSEKPERKKDLEHYQKMLNFIYSLNSKKDIKKKKNKGNLYEVELDLDRNNILIWDGKIKEQNEKVREIFKEMFFPKSFPTFEAKTIIDFIIKKYDENSLEGFAITIDNDIQLYELGLKYLKRNLSPIEYNTFIENENSIGEYITGKYKDYIFYKSTPESGFFIYKELSKKLGSDKKASEFLLSKGIKGVSYKDGFSRTNQNGKKETSNYVVFDPSVITILKENGKRVEFENQYKNKDLEMNNHIVHIDKIE